jgi:hypothetical protein
MREGMPSRQEGKGGKVKSQVAYDTVLEIGGRFDNGKMVGMMLKEIPLKPCHD